MAASSTLTSPPSEKISGLVERVTYHNVENGFCVLRIKTKFKRDLVTLIGHLAQVSAGEHVYGTGQWFNDKQYGLQFRADFLKAEQPTSIEGIEKYLGSGMIKGIGKACAKKLVKAFGEEVFDIIEQQPGKLKTVGGIGKFRAEQIVKGWANQKTIREIMLFLHSNGISTAKAVRIFKTYGQDAIEVIKQNPYTLADDIRGIGFVSADKIALRMGITADSMIRACAGISYALSSALEDGHCGLPTEELIRRCIELLEIEIDLAQAALVDVLDKGTVIKETLGDVDCIFLSGLIRSERNIAEKVMALQKGTAARLPWGNIDAKTAIARLEKVSNFKLAPSQIEAVTKLLKSKVSIITGGPGVGKTTLVNSILKIIQSKGLRIILAAPTGRAAKRLSEVTGFEASTLHRLLKINFAAFDAMKNADSPLQADVIIVDEVSMLDVPLANALFKAIPPKAALILVGDVDQLPSVGPGQVLTDLINSEKLLVIRLTEVFRQERESHIIINSHRINQGLMPIIPDGVTSNTDSQSPMPLSDFYFIEVEEPEDAADKIIRLIAQRIPHSFGFDPVNDIQLLCPMNRGPGGSKNLNIQLQNILNPLTLNEYTNQPLAVQRFGTEFRINDKVMQIVNDYDKDVYNGDIGFISGINAEEQELCVNFDGRETTYDFGELDELVLAYAMTIHKSQGSEYKAVVIPVMTQHYVMLQKNLIYTAVTRGKKLVILVGQKKALAIALTHKNRAHRWSTLKKRLWESAPL